MPNRDDQTPIQLWPLLPVVSAVLPVFAAPTPGNAIDCYGARQLEAWIEVDADPGPALILQVNVVTAQSPDGVLYYDKAATLTSVVPGGAVPKLGAPLVIPVVGKFTRISVSDASVPPASAGNLVRVLGRRKE